MHPTNTNITGIILSAGESSRMGRHKALIEIDEKTTLLGYQIWLLHAAGCERVVVVVGCDANLIIKAHADLEVSWLVNESWRAGQFSSIQKGISEAIEKNNNGVIILPVDTVGISPDTVAAIIESALQNPHLDVIKPEFEGKGGHPTFLSRVFAQNLLNLDPVSAKARLDIQIRNSKSIMRLPVNDKNIISNANTSQTFETLKLEQASCAKKL